MNSRIRKLSELLLEKGELSASRVSAEAMAFFESALQTGTLERIPSKSGRGWVVSVHSRERFEAFLRARFPHPTFEPEAVDFPRARGIQRTGNSKADGQGLDFLVLPLRARSACVVDKNGESLDMLALTGQLGCATVIRGKGDRVCYAGRLALVENQELWAYFERVRLDLEIPLCFYTGGRISWRVLDWLASEEMSAAEIVHFGDYDPVGLAEYVRIKKRLGAERVSLFVPDDLERRFEEGFTTGSILTKPTNRKTLAGLIDSDDPAVRRVLDLILKYGEVHEHEGLLFDLGVCPGLQ